MTPKRVRAGVIGTGYCVPEKVLTNQDLEQMVDTSDAWIVGRTGIHERRIATENEPVSKFALGAARMALADAQVKPEDLDLIIVATLTGDRIIPSTACFLQNALGATKAAAFDLSAACSGFVYSAVIASQFIESGAYQRILVIGAETLSKVVNWHDRNTCVLFGDGAGAAVFAPVEQGGLLSFDLGSDGGGGDALQIPAGGSLLPASPDTVAKHLHTIQMDGREVFRFAVKVMGKTLLTSLQKAGLEKGDVDWLVPHQANIRIIQSAAKRLSLPMEKVIVNIARYGNTSAASIPVALAEAAHQGRFKRGDTLALAGFGAGLTWASCVLQWVKEDM